MHETQPISPIATFSGVVVAEAMLDGKPESLFTRTLKNYPRNVMWNKALEDEKGFDKTSETERNSMQTNSAKAQLRKSTAT